MAEWPSQSEWTSVEQATAYLEQADSAPHRAEGERVILDLIPPGAVRILDLGTGDGRLLDLLKVERPSFSGVALDFSPTMLEVALRFEDDRSVRVVEHICVSLCRSWNCSTPSSPASSSTTARTKGSALCTPGSTPS